MQKLLSKRQFLSTFIKTKAKVGSWENVNQQNLNSDTTQNNNDTIFENNCKVKWVFVYTWTEKKSHKEACLWQYKSYNTQITDMNWQRDVFIENHFWVLLVASFVLQMAVSWEHYENQLVEVQKGSVVFELLQHVWDLPNHNKKHSDHHFLFLTWQKKYMRLNRIIISISDTLLLKVETYTFLESWNASFCDSSKKSQWRCSLSCTSWRNKFL